MTPRKRLPSGGDLQAVEQGAQDEPTYAGHCRRYIALLALETLLCLPLMTLDVR